MWHMFLSEFDLQKHWFWLGFAAALGCVALCLWLWWGGAITFTWRSHG